MTDTAEAGPVWGCGRCRRIFWPSPTQAVKARVPIHDDTGGVCCGSLEPPVEYAAHTVTLSRFGTRYRWGTGDPAPTATDTPRAPGCP